MWAPSATDGLFFAVRPDAAAAARIHALALRFGKVYGLTGKPRPPEVLHVTLRFLGEHNGLPPQLVNKALAMAKGLHGAPFELAFDQVMSFENKGIPPLVLCREDACAPLDALRRQLGDASRGFKPHVTLLYDRKMITLQEVAPPVAWRVTEVLLIHSLIGRTHHEMLARYPLG
jgi:RNA 2',3'-cyclic 3'-phosphodiesterase